ncbi:unnamed protein product [Durusdinium trenchii]
MLAALDRVYHKKVRHGADSLRSAGFFALSRPRLMRCVLGTLARLGVLNAWLVSLVGGAQPHHGRFHVLPDGTLRSVKQHFYASLLRTEDRQLAVGEDLPAGLENVTKSIDHIQGEVNSVQVMRVRLDGDGDTLELISTVVFTMTVSV